ncbi:flavin-containing monooxygenase [Rhizohabitans arisaemae]|uniref:flavin-containing monooxygenase n=1 Tax=Rhizohabitans arisaemae TaxID=2720610 RepID=UPI0024B1F419|nr:NAD(P)-binding domain-containing protein [Rhizohabitans arisaemae]
MIGAGPSGLAVVKALRDRDIPVTCFERGSRIGGLWVFEGVNGTSPAYSTLHLNSSRTRTEFADHPMPGDWPHYPHHTQIASYLNDYAERFDLLGAVRLDSDVEAVTREDDGTWTVTGTGPGGRFRHSFTAVVAASGHNWEARWPTPYPGTFGGDQMHSHDYRSPRQLAGKRVLVVGGGNSAMDIAVDSSHHAVHTTLSIREGVWVIPKHLLGRPSDTLGALTRRLPWQARQVLLERVLRTIVGPPQHYGLPAPRHGLLAAHPTLSDSLLARITHGEITPAPGIRALDGDAVVFDDGARREIDLIVWCTGYEVTIPYLRPEQIPGSPEAMTLYLKIFPPDAEGLYFAGYTQSTGSAFPVGEAQARLIAAHVAGAYRLPPRQVRLARYRRDVRAARERWGDKRPAMRIDGDEYIGLLRRELSGSGVRGSR